MRDGCESVDSDRLEAQRCEVTRERVDRRRRRHGEGAVDEDCASAGDAGTMGKTERSSQSASHSKYMLHKEIGAWKMAGVQGCS